MGIRIEDVDEYEVDTNTIRAQQNRRLKPVPTTERMLDVAAPVREGFLGADNIPDKAYRENLERYVAPIREAQIKANEGISTDSVLDRAEEIQSVVERPVFGGGLNIGGASGASVLGVGRTLYTIGTDIIDGMVGLANVVSFGGMNQVLNRKKGSYDDMVKTHTDLVSRGTNPTIAGLMVVGKLFEEAPEFDDPEEMVQKVINALGEDVNLNVSKREADEITRFFGKGTGIGEQIIRSIPEAYFITKAMGKFALRGSKRLMSKMQETFDGIREGKGLNSKKLLDANAEEFGEVLETWAANTAGKGWFFGAFGKRMRTNMIARRGNRIMDEARVPERMAIRNEKIRKAERNIERVKGTKQAKTARASKIIKEQNKQIDQLKRGYLGSKEIKDIGTTEVFAQAAGITAGNVLGEGLAWVGYLGGGILSGVGVEWARRGGQGAFEFINDHVERLTTSVHKLTDEQRQYLARTGKLPSGVASLDKRTRSHLNAFADMIRTLPEEQRIAAFQDIKFFQDVKERLVKKGVDEKLLNTVVSQATGLIPLMMIRETISSVQIDASKGVKKVSETIADVMEAERYAVGQIKAFEEMIAKVSRQAEELGAVDEQFIAFSKGLNNMRNLAKKQLGESNDQFQTLIDEAVVMLSRDEIAKRLDKEDHIRLIQEIITHDFLKKEAGGQFTLVNIASDDLEEIANDVFNEATARIENLDGGLADLAKIGKSLEGTERPSYSAAKLLNRRFAVRQAISNIKFDRLNRIIDPRTGQPVKIDITKWLTDLYAVAEDQDTYEIIIPKLRGTKIFQALTKTKFKDAEILDSFANINAKESIDNFLGAKENLPFKNKIVEMIEAINEGSDSLRPVIARYDGLAIEAKDVDIRVLRQVYSELLGGGDARLSDFDIFRILDSEAVEAGLTRPTIEIGVGDVQKISSALSTKSRQAFKTQKDNYRKYSGLADGILKTLDTIPGDVGEQAKNAIADAKSYYLNAIQNVFYDTTRKGLSQSVAREVTNTVATTTKVKVSKRDPYFKDKKIEKEAFFGSFADSPENWLKGVLNVKTPSEAREYIENIKRSFGRGDSETETYILDDRSKAVVSRAISSILTETKEGEAALLDFKTTDKFDLGDFGFKRIGDDEGATASREVIAERFEQGTRLMEKAAQQTTPYELKGAAMNLLRNEGLLDTSALGERSKTITKYLSEKGKLDATRKTIKDEIATVKSSANRRAKLKQEILSNVMERQPRLSKALADAENQDKLYNALIEQPGGKELLKDLLDTTVENNLTEQITGDVKTTRELISDLVVDGLLRKTRDKKQVLTGAGQSTEVYDWVGIVTELDRNGSNLREAIGEETFQSIQDFANFMAIATRQSTDRISDLKVTVRLPAGLSIESYISRAYSISRGIISPKYVATEVAILQLRKGRAEALAKILREPEAVDALILLLEEGAEQLNQKQHKKLLTAIVTAIAAQPAEPAEDELNEQMNRLMQ